MGCGHLDQMMDSAANEIMGFAALKRWHTRISHGLRVIQVTTLVSDVLE